MTSLLSFFSPQELQDEALVENCNCSPSVVLICYSATTTVEKTHTTKQKYDAGLMDYELTTVRSNSLLNVLQRPKAQNEVMQKDHEGHDEKQYGEVLFPPFQKVYRNARLL